MDYLYLLLASFYACLILFFFIGIYRHRFSNQPGKPRVAVLVPARNEAGNILDCLDSLSVQTYPKALYTVAVIDDQSTDDTGKRVKAYIREHPNFKYLLHKPEQVKPTFKKEALLFALEQVEAEIIMTIDADTVAQPNWIENMIRQFEPDTGLVAGLVTFAPETETCIFKKLQTLEFAGIVFCGVGSLGNGFPIMCNGSNLSYRRKTFDEVGGYRGHLHLASGDDDLLLQSIHRQTNWKVRYLLHPDSVNYTRPADTLPEFLNQRVRWASKSLHYPSKLIFPLLVGIYLFYLITALMPVIVILGWVSWKILLAGLLLKMLPEALLISKALEVLNRRDLLRFFPVAQFLQVPYILYAGLMGFRRKFHWKGTRNDVA